MTKRRFRGLGRRLRRLYGQNHVKKTRKRNKNKRKKKKSSKRRSENRKQLQSP